MKLFLLWEFHRLPRLLRTPTYSGFLPPGPVLAHLESDVGLGVAAHVHGVLREQIHIIGEDECEDTAYHGDCHGGAGRIPSALRHGVKLAAYLSNSGFGQSRF
ncbi:hypothetical protein N7474_009531 [Penicillium riverlandense]|uniref:uncharacterized protein n=1 Tax=Penicillium riverlandense TaxID=1903569 RepID=UPI002546935A|nr:uncharacterized protein N7474_009531 [Penicillium riverlandense]KAJ5808262.1 hypothetical protein N7474_009531 [Penicillium riverlandense]